MAKSKKATPPKPKTTQTSSDSDAGSNTINLVAKRVEYSITKPSFKPHTSCVAVNNTDGPVTYVESGPTESALARKKSKK